MKIIAMLLTLLLALPSFGLAKQKKEEKGGEIKSIEVPERIKAGDSAHFTIKTDKKTSKVVVEFPELGVRKDLDPNKDHNKWQIKIKMSQSGTKHFEVVAYDSKGKQDDKKKGVIQVDASEQVSQQQQQQEPQQQQEQPVNSGNAKGGKIKSIEAPDQIKAGDAARFTVKTDKKTSKVVIMFPDVGASKEMKQNRKDHEKWEIKIPMNQPGEKRYEVVAYDSKGRDGERKSNTINVNNGQRKFNDPITGNTDTLPQIQSPPAKPQPSLPATSKSKWDSLKGYCTWYVNKMFKAKWGKEVEWGGNAGAWYANAQRYAETGKTPRVESILVTSEGGVGHVAWVTDVSDTHIKVLEMNYGAIKKGKNKNEDKYYQDNVITVNFDKERPRTIPISYNKIKGYIYKPNY